jgi:aromatic ring-opening dioxygenase catalytic subunit (LigB family)
MSTRKQPAIYLSHGGGPCFWMDWPQPIGPNGFDGLRAYLEGLVDSLPERPSAFLIISGHWEADDFSVSTNPAPGMLFDYNGFPPHTYQLSYPAKGDPALAEQVLKLLQGAGIAHATDAVRGFDHGVFVPMLIADPDAGIPVVTMSIRKDYDPAAHIALGEVLVDLREQGVVIIGSGNSYHNLRSFLDGESKTAATFDNWLQKAVTQPGYDDRKSALLEWASAPMARQAHPEEDHLIPLMAVVGAGGSDPAITDFHDVIGGKAISGFRIG